MLEMRWSFGQFEEWKRFKNNIPAAFGQMEMSQRREGWMEPRGSFSNEVVAKQSPTSPSRGP